jgi:AcrR family transcriptional regulator
MSKSSQSPRKRGRGSRSAPTREKILDAALSLFAERGFDATATKDIAEHAGVPNGLIFYHFSTKVVLLETVFRERNVLNDLGRMLETVPRNDPRQMLESIGQRFYGLLVEREQFVQLLLREMHSGRSIAKQFREMRETGIGMVAGLLDVHVTSGNLKPVDTMALSRLFMSGVVLTAIADKPDDPESYIRTAVDIVLCGIETNHA